MMRRGRALRGGIRSRRGGATGLPSELASLLDMERKRRSWRSYLPLWAGAVAVGLAVGAGPDLLRAAAKGQPSLRLEHPAEAEAPPSGEMRLASQSSDTASDTRNIFGFCHTGGGNNCVVDGDTIWIEGEKVRIADIDAPETHDFGCAEEKALGDRATQRLIQLVNGGSVSLRESGRDEDQYGRKLRIVMVDGTSVGSTLVSEGLARYYEGGRRPWC